MNHALMITSVKRVKIKAVYLVYVNFIWTGHAPFQVARMELLMEMKLIYLQSIISRVNVEVVVNLAPLVQHAI